MRRLQMSVSEADPISTDSAHGEVDDVAASPACSVPTYLQKSTETLNSITDVGSIGRDSTEQM